MIIYTAGPFADREYVKDVRDALQAAGFKVKADWLDIDAPSDREVSEAYLQEMAGIDYGQCSAADILVYCNTGYKSEGKATELGIALALGKPIYVVGPGGRSNNIFLNLGQPVFEDVDALIGHLIAGEMQTGLV